MASPVPLVTGAAQHTYKCKRNRSPAQVCRQHQCRCRCLVSELNKRAWRVERGIAISVYRGEHAQQNRGMSATSFVSALRTRLASCCAAER